MTEQTKHTPGPWEAYGEHEFWAVETERQDNGKSEQIATCYSKANARLIAAAPDLLEALEAFVGNENDPMFRTPTQQQYDFARAAIKKARGE